VKGVAAHDGVTASDQERSRSRDRKCEMRKARIRRNVWSLPVGSIQSIRRAQLGLASGWRSTIGNSRRVVVDSGAIIGSAIIGDRRGRARDFLLLHLVWTGFDQGYLDLSVKILERRR